jgi:hypothetical protein
MMDAGGFARDGAHAFATTFLGRVRGEQAGDCYACDGAFVAGALETRGP